MVRGEILTSAWILEPATVSGTHITKVVYMVQVRIYAKLNRHVREWSQKDGFVLGAIQWM